MDICETNACQPILHFWLEELTDKQHFIKDTALDATMRDRFGATLEAAARCELFSWRNSAEGRLAEIRVLDQFSRNIFRDTPRSFAQNPLALVLAQELVAGGHDQRLTPSSAPLPTCQLCTASRYPSMRKGDAAILGRNSRAEEPAFLSEPGSSF